MSLTELKADLADLREAYSAFLADGQTDDANAMLAEIQQVEADIEHHEKLSAAPAPMPTKPKATEENNAPKNKTIKQRDGYSLKSNAKGDKFWWFGMTKQYGRISGSWASEALADAELNKYVSGEKKSTPKGNSPAVIAPVAASQKVMAAKAKTVADYSWTKKLPDSLLEKGTTAKLGCDYLIVPVKAGTKINLPTVIADNDDALVVDKVTGRPVFVIKDYAEGYDHRTVHVPTGAKADVVVTKKGQTTKPEPTIATETPKVAVPEKIEKMVKKAVEKDGINIEKLLDDINESPLHTWLKTMIKDYHANTTGERIREIKIVPQGEHQGDVYALIQDEHKSGFFSFVADWYKISLKTGSKTKQFKSPVIKNAAHLTKREMDAYYSSDDSLYGQCTHWIREAYRLKKDNASSEESKAAYQKYMEKCKNSTHRVHEENIKDEIYAEIGKRRRKDESKTRKEVLDQIRKEIRAAHDKHKADNLEAYKAKKEKEKQAEIARKAKAAEKD